MSVLDPLYKHDGARPAVIIGDTTITYGRFTADIDTMAAWYAGHGLKPGARVALYSRTPPHPNYWDWVMFLGAIRAGLVHSGKALPPDAEAKAPPLAAAVGDPGKLEQAPDGVPRLEFEPSGAIPLAEQLESVGKVPPMKAAASAVRLFRTSGTTGIPKVVAWDDATMALRLGEVRGTSGITPETRLFNNLGMITTTSLRHSLGAWQLGSQVLLAAIGDGPFELREAAVASDHIVSSPYNFGWMLGQFTGPWPGREKRTVELLGGRIPAHLRDVALARACSAVRNLYGSTEAGMVAYGDAALADRHPGAIGFPVPGAEIEIVDEDGRPLPAGEQGTVRVRTQSMAQAYYASEQPLLRDGWFYPGDLGLIEADGLFVVEGRAGDALNVGGATMAVAPIEEKIRQLDGVTEACVLVIPGVRIDLLTVAVSTPPEIDLQHLLGEVAKVVPRGFKIELCRVENMPRNDMGKIVRRDLAERITRHRMRQGRVRRA